MKLRTSSKDNELMAIVGCSCRLPMAPDLHSFWELLRQGRSGITEVPPDRQHDAPARTTRGGYLANVDRFDADFFGISPHEAAAMDPQQRLMLELAWEAMEDAGIVPATLGGSACGVFVGVMADDYAALATRQGTAAIGRHTLVGLSRSIIANRISYTFGLRGPSLVVDTGQSSSAVAVHLACESIRNAECAMAVVGSVHLNLVPDSTLRAEALGALSPHARCFTFDARANGYVRGEGGGVVVLKPLARAVADGDQVYCVIRGSAINSDGDTPGLTQPSQDAQEEVVRLACTRAAVDRSAIQYVELHGTGTKVGDPIEAAALGTALGASRRPGSPLLVGSVKTNIGHLEGAAGMAGVLKVALSIRYRQIPPSLNFERPHPDIPLDRLNLRVPQTTSPWPDPDAVLLAGVSSFGLGGTNCHLVLAEASLADPPPWANADPNPLPWALSARTPAALRAQAARLAGDLAARPDASPADIGFSLATTRSEFAHRAVVIARDLDGFRDGLVQLAQGTSASNTYTGHADGAGRTVFVFPGQGEPWPGMAQELLRTAPVFRDELRSCADSLTPHLGWSPMDVLCGTESAPAPERPEVAQAVLFAVMVGLAALWRSIGVRPDAVVGHSHGEIAAAYAAGALPLADAAALVVLRSRIGVDRAGDSCVPPGAEPIRDRLTGALSGLRPRTGDIAFYSSVTGGRLPTTELVGDYWYRGLRQNDLFGQAVRTLRDDGHDMFIEMSPHPALIGQIQDAVDAIAVGSLQRGGGDWDRFLASAAAAYVCGAPVAWSTIVHGRRVPLPTYPFQRQRHWLDHPSTADELPGADGLLTSRLSQLAERDQVRLVRDLVFAHAAAILGHRTPDAIDPDRTFRDLGFDSLAAVEFRDRVDAATGLRLPESLTFDYPTPSLLAGHLHDRLTQVRAATAVTGPTALERIEAALADLPADGASRAQIRARLRDLLWRLDSTGEPHRGRLDSASDEELIAALENELGAPPAH